METFVVLIELTSKLKSVVIQRRTTMSLSLACPTIRRMPSMLMHMYTCPQQHLLHCSSAILKRRLTTPVWQHCVIRAYNLIKHPPGNRVTADEQLSSMGRLHICILTMYACKICNVCKVCNVYIHVCKVCLQNCLMAWGSSQGQQTEICSCTVRQTALLKTDMISSQAAACVYFTNGHKAWDYRNLLKSAQRHVDSWSHVNCHRAKTTSCA